MVMNKKSALAQLDDEQRIDAQLNRGPRHGDLWMAAGMGLSCYVLIVAVPKEDPRLVLVVPLDSYIPAGEYGSLTIRDTPLGTPMIAWPKYAAIIPMRLLKKPLTGFPEDVVNAVMRNDPGLSASVVPTAEPDYWDEEAHDDDLRALIVWHGMCDTLPDLRQSESIEFGIDAKQGEYYRALRSVLGLSQAESLAVSRGIRKLGRAEQRKMAAAGYAERPKRQEAIPGEYLAIAEQPRWNMLVDAFSEVPESEVRMQLARRAAFTLAARTDGHSEDAVLAAFNKVSHDMMSRGSLQ